jgi:light-independent protochlorophyllide reductase subunit B
VLFDSWVQPMMMGLEEHLLQMFRDDFEFHDAAPASHLPATSRPAARPSAVDMPATAAVPETAPVAAGEVALAAAPAHADAARGAAPQRAVASDEAASGWTAEGERELKKIPFFVRAKARRNTERFAAERGLSSITVETLYEAKAHFGR